MRITRRMRLLLAAPLGMLVLGTTACQPGEVQAFNSIMGTNLTVEQARSTCEQIDAQSGPGTCRQTAIEAVNRKTKGYVNFGSDCRAAVDYLFEGRWDHQRALMVVNRESRFVSFVVDYASGSHKGCAQLSPGLQRRFLQGPWNDPYWNVRALRDAVDAPDYGWCHWDIINYCARGGQF